MGHGSSSSTSFSYTTILYDSVQQRISKQIHCILLLAISLSPYIIKSKKFAFDLLVSKGSFVPSLLSSLRDDASDLSRSEIDYTESVT